MSKRVRIYARVSSAHQRERETIDSQLRALRDHAKGRGWTVIGEHIDDGVSADTGNLANRHGMLSLLDNLEGTDLVLCWDRDRLSRSTDILENAEIMGRIQRARVLIAEVTSGTESPPGDLHMVIKGHLASEENEKRRQTVIRGKHEAARKGRKPGGSTPFGYRYSRDAGTWSIHEPEAEIVREVYQRITAGESTGAIAQDLRDRAIPRPYGGAWSRCLVWRLVVVTTYTGEWIGDKQLKTVVKVPPIVTREDRGAAFATLGRPDKRGISRTRHVYLCEGVAKCGICGGRIVVISGRQFGGVGKRGGAIGCGYYWCTNRRTERGDGGRCPLPKFRIDRVDHQLWKAVAAFLERPDAVADAFSAVEGEADDGAAWATDVKRHEKHIARLEKAAETAQSRNRRGLLSDAVVEVELAANARARAMVERQLETAQVRLAGIRASQERPRELRAAVERLRRPGAFDTKEDRQAVVRTLMDGVHHSVVLGPGPDDMSIFAHLRVRSDVQPLKASWINQRQYVTGDPAEESLTVRLVAPTDAPGKQGAKRR